MTKMYRRLAVIGAVLLLVGGCGGDNGGSDPDQVRPSSTASIDIVEPEPGTVVSSDQVMVRIDLEGGTIVSRASRNLTPDEGHVHLRVDGRVVSETFGLEQPLEVRDSCEGVGNCVEPGNHLLEVEFVAKDHGPFDPRVLDSTSFEVEG